MEKELKIIIVEDSPSDADLLQYELKRGQIRFISEIVSTESAFTSALSSFAPDIILSDFAMPSFDGLSALEIAREKAPDVPFVFVSGTIGEERAIEALKGGATDYILKRHLSGLVPKLKRALQESKDRLERIGAEKRLREREKQLTEAQRVARIGNWEFDLRTGKLTWSEEMYKILGIDSNTVLSAEVILSCIHPEDKERVLRITRKASKTGKDFSFSTRIYKKDNHALKWIFVKTKFRSDDGGQPVKAFGILQDITELKLAEERLKQTNKELLTFIYKASHDLRGPVSSALGLCNMGLNDSKEDSSLRNYFELMSSSLQKLDGIILSLIEVMAIKDRKAGRELINFREIIDEIKFTLKHTEGFQRVKFHYDLGCPSCHSDSRMLISVIQNLLENSVKYQDYRKLVPEVHIRTSQAGNTVRIEISDNGVGIDDNVRDHVFDMFFRGHIGSKGSGLGLYIVKNAVEVLNGTIRLESAPGKGTTFIVEIPNENV